MLTRFEKGYDITLMNTMYIYPRNINGVWDNGRMILTYKDNNTGKKYQETIEDPDFEYWIAKEDEYIDPIAPPMFLEEEKLDRHLCKYNRLERDIYESLGKMDIYNSNINNGNRRANKQIHNSPDGARLFGTDVNIEDQYRRRFSQEYKNRTCPITKAYIDIEVDTTYAIGDFPEPGECPINAVSYIDTVNNKIISYILEYDKNNANIQEFKMSAGPELANELKSFITEYVGGWKNAIRYGVDKFDIEFKFFDDEISLIYEIFNYINTTQPDFVLAWNMAFDIPYIIERIKVLGYDPTAIICHEDFPYKICEYFIDEMHKNEFAERGDKAMISSYSIFIDQMIQFASRRKSGSVYRSFALDYIGESVIGVRKLDYSHITTSLGQLPYLDFKTFIFYNIIDTLVQVCIENKVNDIDYIFNKCLINNTRLDKGHRQTVYLVNRGRKEFYKTDKVIMANNHNRGNEKPTQKYPGAFIADPAKLSDKAKLTIAGQPVALIDNVDDYDYKSLYPSEMREFNMAPNTQIGKIVIPDVIYPGENPYNSEYYTRGGSFIEDLHSGNFLEFCRRWYGLSSFGELYKEVLQYFEDNSSMYIRDFDLKTGYINIMQRYKGNMKIMERLKDDELIRIMCRYSKIDYDPVLNNIPKEGVVYSGY